jgi:hypothetical protein
MKSIDRAPPRWLLLIHQIPPKPAYFRVKVWRRLQGLGAIAVKNSVYLLPRTDQAFEDFRWIQREIEEGGGEASVCEARFVDGLSDEAIEAAFIAARDADYAEIAKDAGSTLAARAPEATRIGTPAEAALTLSRLQRRLAQAAAIDFFGAPGRARAEIALAELERRLAPPAEATSQAQPPRPPEGATWVTRKGIHVDRIASAWLIRRFIDAQARFRFVEPKGYRPRKGEIRFDMFEAEFTHRDGRCTFEVLRDAFRLDDPALVTIGEIVHDIDVKDGKFGRGETAGVAAMLSGLASTHDGDPERLAQGERLFDALHRGLRTAHQPRARGRRRIRRGTIS